MTSNGLRGFVGQPLRSTRARRWAAGLPVAADRPPAIFIHIPKSAGKSVISSLGLEKLNTFQSAGQFYYPGHPVTFGHMSLAELIRARLVSERDLEDAFVFTFVRNPYARAISLFRYLLQIRRLTDVVSPGFRDSITAGEVDHVVVANEFLRFLHRVADGIPGIGVYNTFGLSQANPQVRWLEGLKVDFVGSYERFSSDFRIVSSHILGAEREPEHVNRSVFLGDFDRAVFLGREARALIEQIYEEDFEAFSYDRERCEP